MTTAAPPTVLIIGSGVAGPVLAVLLKRKGYAPIVFEKVRALGDAGASLMLMPNGMKVLDLVGLNTTDLASSSTSGGAFPLDAFEDRSGGGSLLGSSALPSTFKAKYGQPAVGVKRTGLNLALKKMAEDAGIEVREGWALESVSEDSDSDSDSSRSGRKTVTARFANGESVLGDFLIGCDGIKAASRDALQQLKNGAGTGAGVGVSNQAQQQQQQPPAFTGLTQTSGFSPAPAAFGIDGKSVMRNWFGEGVHVIAYPVSRTHVSWAVTLPEADEEAAKESWRIYGDDEREEVKRKLLSVLEETGFEPPVIEMVRSAERRKFFLLHTYGQLYSFPYLKGLFREGKRKVPRITPLSRQAIYPRRTIASYLVSELTLATTFHHSPQIRPLRPSSPRRTAMAYNTVRARGRRGAPDVAAPRARSEPSPRRLLPLKPSAAGLDPQERRREGPRRRRQPRADLRRLRGKAAASNGGARPGRAGRGSEKGRDHREPGLRGQESGESN